RRLGFVAPQHFPRFHVHCQEFTKILVWPGRMKVSGPIYRSISPTSFFPLHFLKGRVIAAHVNGNVESLRLRRIGNRSPILKSKHARAEAHLNARLGNHPGTIGQSASLFIEIEQSLIAEVVGTDELSGSPVELPKDAELTHFEKRLPAVMIDQDALEDFIHVVGVLEELVVPDNLSALRIQCQSTIRVEFGSVGVTTLKVGPRFCLSHGPVDEICCRIVAAGDPRVSASAELERQVTPTVTTRFARPSDG